jgi:hypothetical protein
MTFTPDLFRWLRFAFLVFKLLVKIFGDDQEKEEAEKNGFAPTPD